MFEPDSAACACCAIGWTRRIPADPGAIGALGLLHPVTRSADVLKVKQLPAGVVADRAAVPEWDDAAGPRRLGEVLVARGSMTTADLERALALRPDAPDHRRRLGQVIVDNRLADERDVARALGDLFNLPVVDLAAEPLSVEDGRLLPQVVALRNSLVVVGRTPSGAMRVAAADPKNVLALDDLRLHTGSTTVDIVIATESDVRAHIERVWSMTQDVDDVSIGLGDEDADEPEGDPFAEAEEAPIVRLVASVLADAVRTGASDVHVEPMRRGLRVRMRVDGVLRETLTVPHPSRSAFISRLKIVSGLDIAERRRPQDGRTRVDVGGATFDARVSTLPSLHGEKVVVRMLARAETTPPLSELGLEAEQLDALRAALARTQGLVLITGPTGSGKTSSLFSALTQIHDVSRNIVTLEDPVEIQLPGITQVQIDERAGVTFASGLRAVLRQDPDVVLVGEVRDVETAELALRASLTGHLVLTTVHTNDAVSALTRFVDMGVPPYLVASSLSLVVAQRLVRKPCLACAVAGEPDEATLELLQVDHRFLDGGSPIQVRGCRACGETGYVGRRGVFEVLALTPEVRHALLTDPTEATLERIARTSRMTTLRGHALKLARDGLTTFDEVLRATDR